MLVTAGAPALTHDHLVMIGTEGGYGEGPRGRRLYRNALPMAQLLAWWMGEEKVPPVRSLVESID